MTPVEQEITRLSEIWYQYVGQDHHKDKDCHWYIEKYYSYGEPPYYQAFHWGYIDGDFEGSKCQTIEEAEQELLNAIKFAIHRQKESTKRSLEYAKAVDPSDEFYFMGDVEEYTRQLEILERA